MNSPRAQATGQLHAGGKIISGMTAHHQAETGGHAQEAETKRLEPLDAPRRLPQLDHGQPALGGGPDAVTHPLLAKPVGIGDNVERGQGLAHDSLRDRSRNQWSTRTSAAMASTIGTARGRTQGS